MNLVPITMCGSLRYLARLGIEPRLPEYIPGALPTELPDHVFNVDCVYLDWHVSHVRYEQIAPPTTRVGGLGGVGRPGGQVSFARCAQVPSFPIKSRQEASRADMFC